MPAHPGRATHDYRNFSPPRQNIFLDVFTVRNNLTDALGLTVSRCFHCYQWVFGVCLSEQQISDSFSHNHTWRPTPAEQLQSSCFAAQQLETFSRLFDKAAPPLKEMFSDDWIDSSAWKCKDLHRKNKTIRYFIVTDGSFKSCGRDVLMKLIWDSLNMKAGELGRGSAWKKIKLCEWQPSCYETPVATETS